jgi:hypothetical protein
MVEIAFSAVSGNILFSISNQNSKFNESLHYKYLFSIKRNSKYVSFFHSKRVYKYLKALTSHT